MKKKYLLNYICLIIGLGFPFLLVSIILTTNIGDIDIFITWADHWSNSVRDIYLNCRTCNYPFFGIVVTGGLISVLKKIIGAKNLYQSFRYSLALSDAFMYLLTIKLIRVLKVPNAICVGLFLAVLPSTWAGSSIWGQIDGIVQVWTLLSTIGFVMSISTLLEGTESSHLRRSLAYYFLGGVSAVAGALTKQSFMFSAPALISLWLLNQFLLEQRYGFPGLLKAIWINLIILACLILLDLYLRIPLKELYLYTYLHDRNWGVIARHGFNVWVFLGWDQLSDPHQIFYRFLTPSVTGAFLYVLFMLGLYCSLLINIHRWLRKHHMEKDIWTQVAALFVFSLGLSHLAFNVFLTGTHERYMYHGYPFLIIALFYFWLHDRKLSFRWVAYVAACATAYGIYVLGIIRIHNGLLFPFQNQFFQATMHLVLLVFMIDAWIQINKIVCYKSTSRILNERS